jgi:hypothetical protein
MNDMEYEYAVIRLFTTGFPTQDMIREMAHAVRLASENSEDATPHIDAAIGADGDER